MNNFCGIGRLTADPEIVNTAGGTKIARYTLAIDRRYKQEGEDTADFIRCVCFNKTAEFAEKYLGKGNRIGITGRIQTGSYTNKDGAKVYTTDIIVDSHYFCESRNNTANAKAEDAPASSSDDGFMRVPDGVQEELPFM